MIYALVIYIRNLLYDIGLLRSRKAVLPTVCIGNLALGGTGKTPHTIHLARLLTAAGVRVAVLSLGYGRRTHGFVLAGKKSNALQIGDEPMLIYERLKDIPVPVAVCKDRLEGVSKLRQLQPDLQVVLLDDAMQHRRLKPDFTLLLTSADRPFTADRLLPCGRLRDSRRSARRADMLILTNCTEQTVVPTELNALGLPLLKSEVVYAPLPTLLRPLILTSIARPDAFVGFVRQTYPEARCLKYADHHCFTEADCRHIARVYADNCCDGIITTQKDAMRLAVAPLSDTLKAAICPLPIQIQTDDRRLLQTVLEGIKLGH